MLEHVKGEVAISFAENWRRQEAVYGYNSSTAGTGLNEWHMEAGDGLTSFTIVLKHFGCIGVHSLAL